MAFLADESGGVEEVSGDRSVQNGSLVEVRCSSWVGIGDQTADKVLIACQMPRIFV